MYSVNTRYHQWEIIDKLSIDIVWLKVALSTGPNWTFAPLHDDEAALV